MSSPSPQPDRSPAPREPEPDDPVYRHGRREALVVFLAWLVAGVVTLSVSYSLGYGRTREDLVLILGLPAWVFWGVVIPWLGSVAFVAWFCFGFIVDDDLGEDPEEEAEDGHA